MWSHDMLLRLAKIHRDELLKQAERERAARQMTAKAARSAQLADRILNRAGQHLIIIGQRLQSNHRAVMTSAAMRTAHRNR